MRATCPGQHRAAAAAVAAVGMLHLVIMRRIPCFGANWPPMNVAQCLAVAAAAVAAVMRMTYMQVVSFLTQTQTDTEQSQENQIVGRERESRRHKLGMRETQSEINDFNVNSIHSTHHH